MVLEVIKETYYSLEEKWYGFWDTLNEHLPVSGVIDAIDSVVPSFMLFLLLLFVILIFGVYFVLSANQVYDATFTIKTADGKAVYDTLITAKLMQGNTVIKTLSERTNNEGKLTFKELSPGQEIVLDINISKGTYSNSFTVNGELTVPITLKAPPIVLQPIVKKILVQTPTGVTVTEPVQLTFGCEGTTSILPSPTYATFEGTKPVEVTEPVNCKLQATVVSDKYQQKTYSITYTPYALVLAVAEQPVASLKILIRSGGYPINETKFKIKLSGKQTYETDTGSQSQAIITVAQGPYYLAVSDPQNKYAIVTQQIDATQPAPPAITIEVSRAVKAHATITVVDQATNALISGALVTAKNAYGQEIATLTTDTSGKVTFSFTDTGDYFFAAKKLGDTNGGYFPNEVKQTITADKNITIPVEQITSLNAGKVNVRVVDQDGIQVINAKVMLKYSANDGLVELYAAQNYVLTDVNGEATMIAGKVTGNVYAYAIKGPFIGSSYEKPIAIDTLNVYTVEMQIGDSTININVQNEAGATVDTTAEILTLDGKAVDAHGVSGIISIESGKATRVVKAGQTVYVRVSGADKYETYTTIPITLWPDKTYNVNVTLLNQISEPGIVYDEKVYNENDAVVQSMAAGKKYYAKFLINSDKTYNEVVFNFRVGKETTMENDVVQIDSVEAANMFSETRGVTYDPTKGYSYDSVNTTDGLAKWDSMLWKNYPRGTREVKVWFRIKKNATPNREIIFYFRGKFDSVRVPPSTASQDFYADAFASKVYYVGTEAVCEEGFCANSEWMYSSKDDLYIDSPYAIKQINPYTYHFTLTNNSDIDYGANDKPIYMNITVLGDATEEKRIKIDSYEIKDSLGKITNTTPLYSVQNLAISAFAKNATIETTLSIEGLKEGADVLRFELKSEGRVIYTKDTPVSIVKEKNFTVTISPQFIPALLNTPIVVTVLDEKGNYLPEAMVKSYAKEPGIEQYELDSEMTDRLGQATVDSGALFTKSKSIIEISKEGYSRQTYAITVSSAVIVAAPSELTAQLNTYTKREEIKQVSFANLTTQDLMLTNIDVDAKFKDTINQAALLAYFEELADEDKIVPAEDSLDDVSLLRIQLANSIQQDTFIEPITIDGSIVLTFTQPTYHLTYYLTIPLTVNVTSEAEAGEDCLILKPTSATTQTTENAQVQFTFSLQNACATGTVNVALENLAVTTPGDIKGTADVSIRSSTGAVSNNTSRGTAVDGGKRILLTTVEPGGTYFGTLTYAPSADAMGTSVSIPLSFEAKFQGNTITSNPSSLTFTTNVVSLKECMSITGDPAPVGFKDKSTITIDTSACLGQMIDVILCYNDAGCSGGADGKVSLSKRSFSLQNKSQEIQVYGPTYPGTYGVTVYARTRGTSGFTYVGESPVSFLEPDGKYFNLNKFELNLVGDGSQDAIILTNYMLTETVNVKANECIWGKKDGEFDWSKALSGAMMGAMLGNMIGSTYTPGRKDTSSTDKTPDTKPPALREGPMTGGSTAEVIPPATQPVFGVDAPVNNNIQNPDQWTAYTKPVVDIKQPVVHFAAAPGTTTVNNTGSSFNYVSFTTTILGAVIGGYLMGNADLYKCADHDKVVPFDDFVMLLQGTTVSVSPPNDSSADPVEHTVPSDAGALSFTLGEIAPEWDFTDAQYSDIETVGIRFTNGGLNDPQPRYGTLTINATMHNNGKTVHAGVNGSTAVVTTTTGTTSTSEEDFDVTCTQPTFGNYWIDSTEDAGKCSTGAPTTYSQKYHLRVISGDITGQDAYLKKATTCYMGSLTGATGVDAVPKVKLDWSWDAINIDTCDYTNPSAVYCDASQFTIYLVKKLAALDEFLANNGTSLSCPPDALQAQLDATAQALNNTPANTVISGTIGIKSVSVSTIDNHSTATVTVQNNTGAAITSYLSYIWQGDGGPTDPQTDQYEVPVGTSVRTYEADTPKWDGVYMFTAVMNGPGMTDKMPVTYSFVNKELDNNCWMDQTTEPLGGTPGLVYFVDAAPAPTYTGQIGNETDLYNTIEFSAYLTKDAFTEDFFRDFKEYYGTQVFTGVTADNLQKKIVDYLDSGNFKITKKFMGTNDFEPGLYDVYINLSAHDLFRVIDENNTEINVVLSLIKSPGVDSPFYRMPFDGVLGENGGRQGYGSTYSTAEGEAASSTITVSDNTVYGSRVYTFPTPASNGVTAITTSTKSDFATVNSSVGTRGQIASALASGNTATLKLAPVFATPVILNKNLVGTSGYIAFSVENANQAVATGGNISYWTGAAKSKDFYGGNAVETYNESPDMFLSKLGDNVYGFEFNDATRSGTMYLKSVFFTPASGTEYMMVSKDDTTSIWTPDADFSQNVELAGIGGMQYNSAKSGSTITSLQKLFDAVAQGEVCVSNDGSSTSFWWNPAVIENSTGTVNSLANEELTLVGK